MSELAIFITFIVYTALLFIVSALTAKDSGNNAFFVGNRQSPWFIVAYGMIGASLSGVTFISVPGWVGTTQFSYMMVVFGYLIGYMIIAQILLPVYYRLNLTSIYTYLEQRFGFWSYKTGSFYFLVSRIIGASFRMYLAVMVLQTFVFDAWGIPFEASIAVFVLIILLYTFRSGIRTIVWTDTLQTTFMLAAVVITLVLIMKEMGTGMGSLITRVIDEGHTQIFFSGDLADKRHYLKQFIGGVFIAATMTGLDQDMMQKNLSCRNLKDAKKNILTLSWILVPVNLVFLFLGAALLLFAKDKGIVLPELTDNVFPQIALQELGVISGLVFIVGLIAAAYSSADSALTALTTSFSVDMLGIDKDPELSEKQRENRRKRVHIGMALVIMVVIFIFKSINNQAVIQQLFTVAGYTYGPLLGLYAFGLFTPWKPGDRLVPVVAIVSPVLTYFVSLAGPIYLGWVFGFELLLINGMLTFAGLMIISRRRSADQAGEMIHS